MNLRKFVAPTSNAALKMLRAALGPDAVVLSTRHAGGQCEILALPGDEADRLATRAPAAKPPAPPAKPAQAAPGAPVDFESWAKRRDPAPDTVLLSPAAMASPSPALSARMPAPAPRVPLPPAGASRVPSPPAAAAPVPAPLAAAARAPSPPPAVAIAPSAPAGPARAPSHSDVAPLVDELKRLRDLVESQSGALAWLQAGHRRPLRTELMRELLAAGFSAWFAREVTEHLPDDYSAARARVWVRDAIVRNLRCGPDAGALVEAGGVFALVGPTGVGKTTTTAKLAARCIVRHGAQSLGLVSTDTYRIGAQDQLRIYAKILGVPVHVCHDEESLRGALSALAGKRVVLVDTVGMGQRDGRVAEQTAMLESCGAKRLLLLNAAAQADSLDEVAQAYRAGACAGAALTKVDEAVTLGGVLDVAIRHRAALQFITTGQRVPEDLHAASGALLAHRALRVRARAWTPRPEEFDLVAAGGMAPGTREVRRAG